jgi:23S rRNA (guanosine2251-2'-O)-methyltransferase
MPPKPPPPSTALAAPQAPHPRDAFITIFGRQPVSEALATAGIDVRKVFIANGAAGAVIDRIEQHARRRGAEVERVSEGHLHRLSRNAKQDQGVAADVRNPHMSALDDALSRWRGGGYLLALDGVTNPVNVGMILRSAAGLGCAGVVLPRIGCPELTPMVIKASAGAAYRAPVWRCERLAPALDALRGHGARVFALDAGHTHPATPLPTLLAALPDGARAVFILGNESEGVSEAALQRVDGRVSIPMRGGVESLNVACAAAIVCYALHSRAA